MVKQNFYKSQSEVADILNGIVAKAKDPLYLENDPLLFPHRYSDRVDVESVAFISAMMAWGKRSIILSKLETLFKIMGPSPSKFIMNYEFKKGDLGPLKGFKHRTFCDRDMAGLVLALKKAFNKYGSLEKLFEEGWVKNNKSKNDGNGNEALKEAIRHFVLFLRKASAEAGLPLAPRHMPHPVEGGSACKRMNLFLRWMVRKDGYDLGLWTCIGPENLIVPLDLIVGRAAKCIGLTVRKDSNKWETAEYITESLKQFDAKDPIKYDFALSQIGCPPEGDEEPCQTCVFLRKKSKLRY